MEAQLMLIYGSQLEIVEYKGQRVITLAMIDKVHHRPAGSAKRNFNHNRKHFIPDTDFFVVSPYENRTLLPNLFDPKNFQPTTLVTESGYLMVVKSFHDDLAWKVQRDLVTMYFKAKQFVPVAQDIQEATFELLARDPVSLRSMLLRYSEKVLALEDKVVEMKPKVDFHDDMVKSGAGQKIDAVAKVLGLKPRKFYEQLRKDHILRRDNMPYQDMINNGCFVVADRLRRDEHDWDTLIPYTVSLVTGKGIDMLRRKYILNQQINDDPQFDFTRCIA